MTNNKKNIIIISCIVIGVILISLGIGLFIINKNNKTPDVDPYEKEIIESIIEGNDAEDERNLQNEVIALNATYPDAIGWLRMSGLNIDTAVFQASDNNRYLRNNRDGDSDFWGETFMDYTSKYDLSGYTNLVIYGHNTNADDHFTPLLKYESKEFYENNRGIEFSTLDGNYKWVIFSVFKTTGDNYKDFYIDTNFENDKEFETFVNYFKSKSLYDTGISVSKDDDILTLSTCEYSQTNGRFVVMAKRIK